MKTVGVDTDNARTSTHRCDTERFHRHAITAAIVLMRADPSADLELDTLANTAAMSKFHFLRVFEELTSVSPARFLASLRLECAKRLLLETSLPITTVALEVGYNSVTTFTRLFTAFVGANPTVFRARYHEFAELAISDLVQHRGDIAGALHGSFRLRVVVTPPGPFEGCVFLGLFPSSVPRLRPIVGTLLTGELKTDLVVPSPFTSAFLLAAGFRRDVSMKCYFLPPEESTLVGAVAVRRIGTGVDLQISLRHQVLFDPPIVIALPLLLINTKRSATKPSGR
jgi:AraC family transcriptional regulator